MSGSIWGGGGISISQAGTLQQAILPSQRWTGQRVFSVANSVIASNTLYAGPFIPTANMTVDQMAIRVATGLAGSGKLGIYSALTTLLPDALLGEITTDLDTTSIATVTGGFAVNPTLRAGTLYWLASCFSAAPTIFCWNHAVAQNGGFIWPVGSPTAAGWFANGNATSRVTRNAPLVYVPATQFFPASFGAATEGIGTPGAPVIALRNL